MVETCPFVAARGDATDGEAAVPERVGAGGVGLAGIEKEAHGDSRAAALGEGIDQSVGSQVEHGHEDLAARGFQLGDDAGLKEAFLAGGGEVGFDGGVGAGPEEEGPEEEDQSSLLCGPTLTTLGPVKRASSAASR